MHAHGFGLQVLMFYGPFTSDGRPVMLNFVTLGLASSLKKWLHTHPPRGRTNIPFGIAAHAAPLHRFPHLFQVLPSKTYTRSPKFCLPKHFFSNHISVGCRPQS